MNVGSDRSRSEASGAPETKACPTCGRRFTEEAQFCPKDGTGLAPISVSGGPDPYVGREILGHIELKALIGAGAMGRVYRAYQRGVDRDVAVKILHRDLANNADVVARFLREAKLSSRLSHPHIVQVLLAGQLDDGTMYLVMEYLDGSSLQAALLAAGGALPLGRALRIVLQICEAVGHAHESGVIHRDVKPENVMLVRRGDESDFVKVLDFGIARLASPERTGNETQAGLVFGTARYISPEGARGEQVGPPSDVYAIATVAYQLLSGRTPFESDSSVSLLVAQIHEQPPALRAMTRGAYVPPAIEAAIMKNLAKVASARDADAHAFGRALVDAALSAGFVEGDLLVRPAVARRTFTPPLPSPALTPTPLQAVASAPRIAAASPLDADRSQLPTESLAESTSPSRRSREEPASAEPGSILGASTGDLMAVAGLPRRGRRWLAPVVLVSVLALVGGAVGAYRAGWLGGAAPNARQAEFDARLAKAQAAIDARHWDAPPHDNVVELTDGLLADAPSDGRIIALRTAAADKIVREALDKKAAKDWAGALASLRLAARLSPSDKGLEEEIEETEAELAQDPNTAGLVSDAGSSRFVARLVTEEGKAAHPGEPYRLTVEIGDGPAAGEDAPRRVDGAAHFTITPPSGGKPLQIAAKGESATRYVATYAFATTGSYKVRFFARPDGFPLSVDAQVTVVSAGGRPSTTTTATTSAPPTTSGSVRWPTAPVTSDAGPSGHPGSRADAGAPTTPGTIMLTPDPVPLPVPTSGAPPPPPLPTLP